MNSAWVVFYKDVDPYISGKPNNKRQKDYHGNHDYNKCI